MLPSTLPLPGGSTAFSSPRLSHGRRHWPLQGNRRPRHPNCSPGTPGPILQPVFNVEADDLQASYEITQHLLKLGHKRIAFLRGPRPPPGRRNASKVTAGPCARPALEVDDKLVFQAGRTIEDGAKAALRCSTKHATPPPFRRERHGGSRLRQFPASTRACAFRRTFPSPVSATPCSASISGCR